MPAFEIPIPSPIDELVDFVFNLMKYNSRINIEPAEEKMFKEMIKNMVFASCMGTPPEPINPMIIMQSMKMVAELPRNEREQCYNLPIGTKLSQLPRAIEFIQKSTLEQQMKLEKKTEIFSKDPQELKADERAEYEKQLKIEFRQKIESVDKEGKLSPEDKNKLADECAHKLMSKPSSSTLNELVKDVEKKIKLAPSPKPKPGEEKKPDAAPEAKKPLAAIGEISVSQFGELKDEGYDLGELAKHMTRLDMRVVDSSGINSHIMSVLEHVKSLDTDVLLEDFKRNSNLPTPAPK